MSRAEPRLVLGANAHEVADANVGVDVSSLNARPLRNTVFSTGNSF
jgi:hypothetical protein